MKWTGGKPARGDAVGSSRIGRKTMVGSAAPCCARYMKMVTGNRVSDDAFKTRNKICALLAVSGLGLSVWSSFMARKPMGVAALSRPRPLAAKFKVISPSAGCPAGTSGIRRSEEHTSELQSLMRISYAVFCLKKKKHNKRHKHNNKKHNINRQNRKK